MPLAIAMCVAAYRASGLFLEVEIIFGETQSLSIYLAFSLLCV